MIQLSKPIKYEFQIVLFAIILLQLALGFQGFDVCDDGFALTFYQQIFKTPSSVEYSFVYWLSGLVGGLWYAIYPDGGIWWFKIFTVLINTLTFVIAYHIFKRYMSARIALLGLLMVLFVNDFGFLVYYHNHLTALLAVLSVFMLLQGLNKGQYLFLLISGGLIGLNIFTRLTNLSLLVFILAIPFYHILNGSSLKTLIKPLLIYILGVVIGVLIIALLLVSLGQTQIMYNALSSLFDLGATTDSTHNIGSLIRVYISNYWHLLSVISELLFISLLFFAIYYGLKPYKWLRNIVLLIGCAIIFLWFKNGDVYTVYAIGYVGSVLVLLDRQQTELKTLAFLGILMLTFLPLGSGGAIVSSGYMCIWLSVPFFFYFFNNLKEARLSLDTAALNYKLQFTKKSLQSFTLCLLVAFFAAKAWNVSHQAYFDPGSRIDKTFVIQSDFAKGIYTTEKRARIINELLVNLENYLEPEDYLLAYDKIPMLHFLTNTRPYMYNSWVWIYDSESFEKKLHRAEQELGIYPIIVTQKFETVFAFSEPIPNYLAENWDSSMSEIRAYDAKKNKTLNAFINRNAYEVIWSNAYFNILKSKKTTNN